MALGSIGIGLVCVKSMMKMKKVHTVSLSFPFNPSARNLSSIPYNFRNLLILNTEISTAAHTLTHPTLLIASTGYIVTVTTNFPEQMRPLVPDLKVESVNGGHWLQLEKADEVNKILEGFMAEKRPL